MISKFSDILRSTLTMEIASISNILENDATKHLMLNSAFKFAKKVSGLVKTSIQVASFCCVPCLVQQVLDSFWNCDICTLCLYVGQTQKAWVSSNISKFGGFDLIIADLPEGLLIPNVSSPLNSIPSWNEYNHKDIEALFEFAIGFLTYNASLLSFLPELKKSVG